ncbi:MAG: stage II sporulation protein R [Firmicutes bacterium]|nr:stage II sporulation protein R [Bacillota bacterium]
MRGMRVRRTAVAAIALLAATLAGVLGAARAQAPDYRKAYTTSNLVRIHIIANSDSDDDQRIKLAVRDRILEDISPAMRGVSGAGEAEDLVRRNLENIEKAAAGVVREAGKSYGVKATIGRFQFPPRVYGQLALPEGEYRALRVVLGEGRGQNWWCVMFPPLCLVDVTEARGAGDPAPEKPGVRLLVADWLKDRANDARLALSRMATRP